MSGSTPRGIKYKIFRGERQISSKLGDREGHGESKGVTGARKRSKVVVGGRGREGERGTLSERLDMVEDCATGPAWSRGSGEVAHGL